MGLFGRSEEEKQKKLEDEERKMTQDEYINYLGKKQEEFSDDPSKFYESMSSSRKKIFAERRQKALNQYIQKKQELEVGLEEERKLRSNETTLINEINETKKELESQRKQKEIREEEYNSDLRKCLSEGMTHDEILDRLSKKHSKYYKENNIGYSFFCGNCKHLLSADFDDRQIQCPHCNFVNHIDESSRKS